MLDEAVVVHVGRILPTKDSVILLFRIQSRTYILHLAAYESQIGNGRQFVVERHFNLSRSGAVETHPLRVGGRLYNLTVLHSKQRLNEVGVCTVTEVVVLVRTLHCLGVYHVGKVNGILRYAVAENDELAAVLESCLRHIETEVYGVPVPLVLGEQPHPLPSRRLASLG
jgi:hypothetical protein